jgi:hypothetical protein
MHTSVWHDEISMQEPLSPTEGLPEKGAYPQQALILQYLEGPAVL